MALFLAICLALGVAGALPHRLPAQSTISPTILYPGDAVRITVWRQPELSGEFWIAADSSIRHPLYQSIKIAGLPMDSARAMLAAFLKRFQDEPQFVIEPLLQVAIGGEVSQPGLHTFRPEVTIAQAVVLAGGLTPHARLESVRLLRQGRPHSVDLTRPEQGLAAQRVLSGDQIMVLARRRGLFSYLLPSATVVTTIMTLITVFRN